MFNFLKYLGAVFSFFSSTMKFSVDEAVPH